MSVLHLLWIVPLSAWFGFALAAALAASKRGEPDGKEIKEGKGEKT